MPLIDIVRSSESNSNNYVSRFVKTLIPLLAAGAVYISAAGCEAESGRDQDCKDNSDCNAGEKCDRYGKCIKTEQPISAKQIEETYSKFVQALGSNNLEQALNYFHPAMRDIYSNELSGKNLQELAQQLSGTIPTMCEGQLAVECIIDINGEQFPMQFQSYDGTSIGDGTCTIRNF